MFRPAIYTNTWLRLNSVRVDGNVLTQLDWCFAWTCLVRSCGDKKTRSSLVAIFECWGSAHAAQNAWKGLFQLLSIQYKKIPSVKPTALGIRLLTECQWHARVTSCFQIRFQIKSIKQSVLLIWVIMEAMSYQRHGLLAIFSPKLTNTMAGWEQFDQQQKGCLSFLHWSKAVRRAAGRFLKNLNKRALCNSGLYGKKRRKWPIHNFLAWRWVCDEMTDCRLFT